MIVREKIPSMTDLRNFMDPRTREVQLSQAANLDALASYQQNQPDVVGPAISKILERQRRDAEEGEEMKRRTRILYALLGGVLLCVYFTLLKRHFFQNHGIVVPPVSKEADLHGTRRR